MGLIAAAIAVAVVAFLVLQPGDDEDESDSTASRTTQTQTTPEGTDTTQGGAETQTTTEEPRPEEPEIPPIEIRKGKPVGGVEEFQFEKGETIEFAVKSDAEHEIHLHGYDVSKDVRAGGTVKFRVKAKIEGVFEVEIEDTHTPIAEVKVVP